MREGILKADANPPRILWASAMPAMINLFVQMPLMFMAIGVFDLNPLIFLISIICVHTAIAIYSAKEPHISTMMQSYGETRRVTQNLYKVKGSKFEP